MSKTISGFGLFAAGAGIGAALAILYAPRAGKHTRAQLRRSANRALHRAEEVRDDVRAQLSEWVDETSDAILSSISSCGKAGTDTGERLQETLNRVRHRMDEGRQRVEEYVKSLAG
jgi:gas vesicle protein